MIWKQTPELLSINQLAANTLVSHLDIRIEEIGPDFLKASMPVDERTRQPDGILHGGATASLAETAGSIASYLMISDPVSYRVAGIDLHVSHLASASSGRVMALVKPIRTGRNIHVWNIEIFDNHQILITHAKLTVMVIKRKA